MFIRDLALKCCRGAMAVAGAALYVVDDAYIALTGVKVKKANHSQAYGGTAWKEYPLSPRRIEWIPNAYGKDLYFFGWFVSNREYGIKKCVEHQRFW